jgi:hypothetical protein
MAYLCNLCKCHSCKNILIDTAPSGSSTIISEDIIESLNLKSLIQLNNTLVCPNCLTDKYLEEK